MNEEKYKGFIRLEHDLVRSEVWAGLSANATRLLIGIWDQYNGHNNGEIVMSVRQAAKLINCNKNTAAKTIKELEGKGWIRQSTQGSFSQKTNKTASTWRITNQPIGMGVDTPESKEYASWTPR